jgi:hypothetical protein
MNVAMHQPRALVHRDVNRYKLIAIALAIMLAGVALMAAPALGARDSAALGILAHLGMFLAPTGLITLIYEVALRRSFLAEVREQLADSLASHFHAAERLADAGIADLHDCLPDDAISRSIGGARESVRILQTWIPNLLQIERALTEAVGRGCRVRMLLLDAASLHCAERSRDLGYVDERTITSGIELNLKQLASWAPALGALVEVRTYRATPTMSLYACDDRRWLGLFWRKRRCSQGPHIEIRGRDSFLGVEADRHFEDLWSSAAPVDFTRMVTSTAELVAAR